MTSLSIYTTLEATSSHVILFHSNHSYFFWPGPHPILSRSTSYIQSKHMNQRNILWNAARRHICPPMIPKPKPAMTPAMQAAAVCLGAAFPLPAMLPSVHWAVWKSWQAWDDRLEQMDVALAVGTVACVGSTVVPPPPGTTTVTPYPLPPPRRPDVQAL